MLKATALVLTLVAMLLPAHAKARVPTVSSTSSTVSQPVYSGQQLAQVQIKPPRAKPSLLVPVVSQSYFAIDATGNITVTAAGVTALNAQTGNATYTLTVAATNAGGTGTGTVTVLVKIGVPVIAPNQTFNVSTPVVAGQKVGTVQATGAPTTWTITGGTP